MRQILIKNITASKFMGETSRSLIAPVSGEAFLIMKEIWKQIPGYANYEASNKGRIRNANKLIMRQRITGTSKYYMVGLYSNGKRKNCLVHRLIALTHISNPNDKKTVNHKDLNKLNNNITNLEWATKKENIRHAFDNGLKSANRKPVKIHNLKTNEIFVFDSLSEAGRFMGYPGNRGSNAIWESIKKNYKLRGKFRAERI